MATDEDKDIAADLLDSLSGIIYDVSEALDNLAFSVQSPETKAKVRDFLADPLSVFKADAEPTD
jgi:hypothetical protein